MKQVNELPPHVQRMTEERQELQARIEKETVFAGGPVYLQMSSYDRTLFDVQLATMNDYQRLLSKRIERASGPVLQEA